MLHVTGWIKQLLLYIDNWAGQIKAYAPHMMLLSQAIYSRVCKQLTTSPFTTPTLPGSHDVMTTSLSLTLYSTHLSVFQINLVANDYEGEIFRVTWAGLDEEFVSPTVEGLERIGIGDIVDKYTTVGSSIKCYSETLESFLTSCVPNLEYFEQIRGHGLLRHKTCASTYMLSNMTLTWRGTGKYAPNRVTS